MERWEEKKERRKIEPSNIGDELKLQYNRREKQSRLTI